MLFRAQSRVNWTTVTFLATLFSLKLSLPCCLPCRVFCSLPEIEPRHLPYSPLTCSFIPCRPSVSSSFIFKFLLKALEYFCSTGYPLCLIHICHYVPSLCSWEFFSPTSSGLFVSYDPCLPLSKLIFSVVEDILQEFPEKFCVRVNNF